MQPSEQAAGAHVIPPADYTVTPAFPDTGAAGQGGRRFHLTYRTTLTAESPRSALLVTQMRGCYAVPGLCESARHTLKGSSETEEAVA